MSKNTLTKKIDRFLKTAKKRGKKMNRFNKSRASVMSRFGKPISGVSNGPLPLVYKCKFRFNAPLTLTNGGAPATLTKHQFRMNSLHDPDFTAATTRQPRCYDQLVPTIYGRVRVNSVLVQLDVTPTAGTGANNSIIFGYQLNEFGGTVINTTIDAHECIGVKTYSLNDTKRNRISFYVPCHKALGLSQIQYKTDPNTSHFSGGNPNTSAMLTIFIGSSNGLTTSSAQVDVTLIQYSVLFDRTTLPSS